MNVKDKCIKLSEAQFIKMPNRELDFFAEVHPWFAVLIPLHRLAYFYYEVSVRIS